MLSQKAEREEGRGREHTEEHTQEILCEKTAKSDNHEASPETSLNVDLYHQNYEKTLFVILSLRSLMQR